MPEEFKQYERTAVTEMRPYAGTPEDDAFIKTSVSISYADKQAGSPKLGDMIARNPNNHSDMWLVSEQWFKDNYREVA